MWQGRDRQETGSGERNKREKNREKTERDEDYMPIYSPESDHFNFACIPENDQKWPQAPIFKKERSSFTYATFKEGKCWHQNSFYLYYLQVSSVKLTKIIQVRTNEYYLELHVAKNHPPLPR